MRVVLGLMLAGCGGAKVEDTESPAAVLDCSSPFPEENRTSGPSDDWPSTTPIGLFAEGTASPDLTLMLDGQPLAGSWAAVETNEFYWVFSPAQAILPGTTYSWQIWAEEGCSEGSFVTSDVGLPVTDPDGLIGRTFEVPISIHTGLAMVFVTSEWPTYWMRIDQLDGTAAHVTLARTTPPYFSDQPVQDTCGIPAALVGTWDGARLHFEGDGLELPIGYVFLGITVGLGAETPTTLELTDWTMDVVVHPDGTKADLELLSFDADIRGLTDFFSMSFSSDSGTTTLGGDGSPTSFCTAVAPFIGDICEACDDGLKTCIHGEFSGNHVSGESGVDLIDLADGQEENHLCAGACDNGVDDDADDSIDDDAECDPLQWPA